MENLAIQSPIERVRRYYCIAKGTGGPGDEHETSISMVSKTWRRKLTKGSPELVPYDATPRMMHGANRTMTETMNNGTKKARSRSC